MTHTILTRLCLLMACLWLVPAWAIDPLPFESPAQEARFQALTADLRCVLCQNQSLADSNAPIAQDLRKQVFEQMQAGQSDEEIKAYLVDRYGDFVLYDPPFNTQNALLWLLPGLIVLFGTWMLWRHIKQRSTQQRTVKHDSGEEIW